MASEMMDGFIAGKMDSGGNGNGMCMPVMPAYGYGMPWGMGMGMGGFGGWGMGGWGEWFPMLIIAALIFGNGNGFGFGDGFGGHGGAPWATQGDVRAAVDQQTLISKLDQQTYGLADSTYALNNTIQNGFHNVDNAVCTLGYQTQQGFSNLAAQLAQCCCDTRAAIQGVNTGIERTGWNLSKQISDCCCDLEKMNMQNRFDAAQMNCGTLQAIDKLGDRIIGYMSAEKTQNLRDENQALRLAASQAAQNQYLIGQLRPAPVPAYPSCNPYAASFGFGNGWGGWGGWGRNDGCGCGCAA